MNTYKDGLNYVPLLAAQRSRNLAHGNGVCLSRSSTPLSSRRGSIICYNGNYEGDLSMFGSSQPYKNPSPLRRLELVETDSDTEYKRELQTYQPQQRSIATYNTWKSQLARLLLHYCDRVIAPKRRKQVTAFTNRLYKRTHYKRISELFCRAAVWLLWLLRIALLCLLRITNGSFGYWRCCNWLRNSARRLLWWMTLAKCGDAKLFMMILLGIPLLFIVAFVGLFLSIYSAARDYLSNSSLLRRFRVI
ncbi:uncharacterized protein [Eurosta solidaginis]|uniref:uncharacterized protein n=1 Tax=Eurosta solidaginis TaxID=178769 RepID=UPI00353159C6